MKRTLILALALVAVTVTSCDFVRTIAGRPTAAEVDAIRIEKMRAEEAAHQARLDSMKKVQQQMADSLAALEAYLLDSLAQAKGSLRNPSKLGGMQSANVKEKYCIVVGAFRDRSNAERKRKACEDEGFKATIISFRNGLNAVAVCPSDDLNEVLVNLKAIRSSGAKDSWILANK